MIKPTVGRIVLFTPSKGDSMFQNGYNPPFAAHIAYVWSDSVVNLMVTSPEGQPEPRTSVTLVQDGEPKPEFGSYCEWMDYQKSVAKGEIGSMKTRSG